MIQNAIFRECLAAIPAEQKAVFDLQFDVSDRIAEILKEKGISQHELAKRLHKRDSEISKWLTGRHNFTIGTISMIESAVGDKIIRVV